jgi:diguanylate cyclase (GGDEF)-like protein
VFGRQGGRCALLYLDLDDFKQVNDTLGHGAGDDLLRLVAARLSGFAREDDVVARIGGDEFVLLRTCDVSRAELAELAADIALVIGEPLHMGASQLVMRTSIGIALAPEHAGNASDLVRAADRALYQAKSVRGGCFLFADASAIESTWIERRTG